MVSSKGKPTDPKLREEAKEGICLPLRVVELAQDTDARVDADVKQMPNKDGSGKGQMAAWKVSCLRAFRLAAPLCSVYLS